jgi:alkylation response protein AidB-like acyl-CoA dehydrogenase
LIAPSQRCHALAPLILERSDAIERNRELPDDVVEALCAARVFHWLVPESLGGEQLDLPEFLRCVETLARADASVGWCVNQAAIYATSAAWLPAETAREIWAADHAIIANGPPPAGLAQATDGGYRVSGRWRFSSGCRHATWMAGVSKVADTGDYHILFFPKMEARFHDTWQVQGLRGTGSYDFEVDDLFVPTSHAYDLSVMDSEHAGSLYRIPMFLLFACGFSAVALGVARAALDEVIEIASGKTPRFAQSKLQDDPHTHERIGRAETQWRSARAFLHHTVDEVWQAVVDTDAITLEQRAALRMAGTHGIRQCKEVVDLAYDVAGTDAIFADIALQRRFQDMQVIAQHVQARTAMYPAVGRFLLGHRDGMAPMI